MVNPPIVPNNTAVIICGMQKTSLFKIVVVILVLANHAHAQFINGSFEDGTFKGWTLNGGTWSDNGVKQNFTFTGNPGTSAIVGVGNDAQSGNGLKVPPLPTNVFGTHVARVNDLVGSSHFTVMSQKAVWKSDAINFAWAAVFQDPKHPEIQQPFFRILLTDVTKKNLVLYDRSYNATNIQKQNVITLKTGVGDWLYTPWNVEHLNTKAYKGDQLLVEIWGADCDQGGHGGYVYVDAFQADALVIGPMPVMKPPVLITDKEAIFSATETGLPMALAQRELALSAMQTVLRDINGRLFRMRAGISNQDNAEAAAPSSLDPKTIRMRTGASSKSVISPDVSPQTVRRWELFGSVDFGNTDRENSGATSGYGQSAYAGTVGAEYRISQHIILGIAGSEITSNGNLAKNVGDADLSGFAISPYLSFFYKNFYFDALYSFGQFEHDLSRNTIYGGSAHATPKSNNHTLELNTGYNFHAGGFVTGPIASMDYTNGNLDGYTESGAGRFNVRVNDQGYESLRTQLGWQISYPTHLGTTTITPQVRVSWLHESLDGADLVGATLLQSPYLLVSDTASQRVGGFTATNSTSAAGSDALSVGGGVMAGFGERASLLLDYQVYLGQARNLQQFASLRASINF